MRSMRVAGVGIASVLSSVPDFDLANTLSAMRFDSGPVIGRHRTSGGRAHRVWRKVRRGGRP